MRDFKLNQPFLDKLDELSDLLSVRIYWSERVLSHQMDENRREISEVVNEITANKNYNLIVDTRLDTMLTDATPLTQLFDQGARPANTESRESRRAQSSTCHLVSLSSFMHLHDEKVEDGEVNFTMGVFSKNYNGFITDFFSMTDMRNQVKTQRRKKFVLDAKFRDNPDLYLIVMVMLVDPSKANKCKAIGMMRLDLFLKDNSEKQIITHTSKDYTVGVIDQIQRIMNEKEKTESHEFKFRIKEIKEGSQEAADFLFMKGDVPSLSEKKRGAVNKLFLTIESGKFTGANKIFAETFNISLDVELFDQNGQPVERIRTSEGEELSSLYKAITCPDNNKCEWREVIQIGRDWSSILFTCSTQNIFST